MAWTLEGSIRGPQGPQGDPAPVASTLGVVVHGSGTSGARPSGFTVVAWVGSGNPANAVDGDLRIRPA